MLEPETHKQSTKGKDPAERSNDLLSRCILLVNDDHDFLEMIVTQFNRHGFQNIITAQDGEDALQKLSMEKKVDLVVSDINMPCIDGFQLCRIMKSGEFRGCDDIPIILVSATYRDVIAEQLARDVGANAYIQAPYEEQRLIDLVLTCLAPDSEHNRDWEILNSQGNILVLDDDEDILKLVKAILQEDAWNVIATTNHDSAKKTLLQGEIQIFLLDVQMPNISGLEMLQWVKEQMPNVVVVMMTAHGKEELVVDLIRAGADDYVKKPLPVKELPFLCQKALKRYNIHKIHEQFKEKINRLKEIKEYLDNLINNSQDAIFSVDRNSCIIVWNSGAEQIYGWRAAEVIGKPIDQFVDPPNHDRSAQDVLHIIEQEGSFTEKEIYRRKKDGTIFPVTATYSPIVNSQGEVIGMSVVEKDISMSKRLEKELIKTEKLRVITQLAVTANDQINTPLGVILGYSQFLKRKVEILSSEDHQFLDIIIGQVYKIKDIMNQLRQLSEPMVKDYAIEGVTMLDLGRSKEGSMAPGSGRDSSLLQEFLKVVDADGTNS
jgi:PAS domain S-box-containing protein